MLAVPILGSDGTVFGVVEMLNKGFGRFGQDDLKLIQSLGSFTSLTLENRKAKLISERGPAEIELNAWVSEMEKTTSATPKKLVLSAEQMTMAFSLNFFSVDFAGIGSIKVAFAIFNSFHLLETHHISSALFFSFLFELRQQYNDPPYHNWTHAVDVLQYCAYEVRASQTEQHIKSRELLAMFVAAVAHDAGHEGLNNMYNVNAETPLGILFKDRAVLETFHCTVLIRIIARPECNIFRSVPEADLKQMWRWIIHFILATDMGQHFKLLQAAGEIVREGGVDLSDDQVRLTAMTLLMKCGDISNVARPFEIAERWCDILCEEFWRQGDREKELGLAISSPLNDRANTNKPQGQVGFYNFICLPLYQLAAKIFPGLEANLRAVEANLEEWKARLEADPKA
jgi:hypothetical protein